MIASILVGILLVAGLAAFASLVPSYASAQAPFRTLNIGVGGDNLQVTTTNPMKIILAYEFVIVYNVYSTLLSNDDAGNSIPDLALRPPTVEADQRTWTFQLVPDAYFTDPRNPADRSHPVTSHDVNVTFNVLKSVPNYFSTYVDLVEKVVEVDPYTVQIVLVQPVAVIESIASNPPILPAYIWESVANPLAFRNDPPIGSGAMYFDVVNSNLPSLLVLHRNPNYYGDQHYCKVSRPDEVRYNSYTVDTVMIQDFQAGRLDIIDHLTPTDYNGVLRDWSPKWAVSPGIVMEVSINQATPEMRQAYGLRGTSSPLLLDATVRKAVAMSINKSYIVENAVGGLGVVADTLVPPSNTWHYDYPDAQEFKFDPLAARALLNAAGWRYDAAGADNPNATPLYKANGQDPLIFRFYTIDVFAFYEAATQFIVQWLAQAGFQTTDKLGRTVPGYGVYNTNVMYSVWVEADYDMWLWHWIFAATSDPLLDILSVETTDALKIGFVQDNYWSNSTYDALYNQSLTTLDPVQRRQLINQMQAMIYEYASYILPWYRVDLYAARTPTSAPGWTGYGDWEKDTLLADDSAFPNLFLRISPLDNQAPRIASIAPVQWESGSPATLSVSANDPEGQPLSYFWDFGDGANVTSTSGTVQHTYAQPGNYTATVRVKDSEWPVCASTTAEIFTPGANLPPQVSALRFVLSHGSFEEPKKPITFSLNVSDIDGDPVTVRWDFGDGSPLETDTVSGTTTAKTVVRSHAYQSDGTYTITLVATDNQPGVGQHNVTLSATVQIETVTQPPPPPTGGNPLIDYGVPLLVAALIVAAVAATVLRRRRREREEEKQREESGRAPPPAPPPPQ